MLKKADFIVVGSGIAGLTFALEAAAHGSVTLFTKKQESESNTNYAQGGIAVVQDEDDSFERHIADTVQAGAGLCRKRAVEAMVREGPQRLRDLIEWGIEFSSYWKDGKKTLALGREGGHSRDRIVHKADHTGRDVEAALVGRCAEQPSISIVEHSQVVDLIVTLRGSKRRCAGVVVLTPDGGLEAVIGRIVFLASGGCGQVYLHTTNPDIATGDGIAMAFRAGARVSNLEFMQFHPTALYPAAGQAFLISEAVRGFGGVIRDADGTAFMRDYHPLADLAPRDVVARAIDNEMKSRGVDFVYLDVTGRAPDEVRERFPNIYRHCLLQNIDITRQWIPVVPAAHYMCGGIAVDLHGRTSLAGLYAAGEVACSGVHGANRLASNSLLEAIVFSHRAAVSAAREVRLTPQFSGEVKVENSHPRSSEEEMVLVSHDRFQIRKLMWDYVGIVRSTLRLERARRRIDLIGSEVEDLCERTRLTVPLVELRNIALVASLIIRSALKRRESRGLHYTTDHPEPGESRPPRDTILQRRRSRSNSGFAIHAA